MLHDDVIDHAETRRNQLCTHSKYGGTQSILMGDFIYSSAFKLIAELNNTDITHILAKATGEIIKGEILQLSLQNNIATSLDNYMAIIRAKTALLFSTGAQCVHTSSGQEKHAQATHDYGYHFGMLYQITDDILDIDVENKLLNKAHGTDLSEGKMTLPTILAYQHASKEDKNIIHGVVKEEDDWETILPVLKRTNALERCKPYLNHHCQEGIKAISELPDSTYKQNLIDLITNIPNRKR